MELKKYSQFNDIALYIKEVNSFPMLTPEEERSLAIKYYETKDIELAKKLVSANLRFVVKVAFEYINYGLSLLDLIQEGNLGLMLAVKKFNPYKNYRLISYAIWWIRAYIQNFIMNNYSIVKLGTTQNQRKLFYSLPKVKKELAMKGVDLNDAKEDVARLLDVTPVELDEMELRLSARDFSLEYAMACKDKDNRLPIDILPDYRTPEVELIEEQDELQHKKAVVQKALSQLNEKERFIIENRILKDEPLTLQEVGDKLGITRERVRQLEVRALDKLKKNLSEHQVH